MSKKSYEYETTNLSIKSGSLKENNNQASCGESANLEIQSHLKTSTFQQPDQDSNI